MLDCEVPGEDNSTDLCDFGMVPFGTTFPVDTVPPYVDCNMANETECSSTVNQVKVSRWHYVSFKKADEIQLKLTVVISTNGQRVYISFSRT